MSTFSRFQADLGALEAELRDMGAKAPAILSRSLNRAGTAGKTAMSRAVVSDIGLATKYVTREIKVDNATRAKPVFGVVVQGRRIPLFAFQARQTRKGVTYKIGKRSRGRVPVAFIRGVASAAQREQGISHLGVFIVKKAKARQRSRRGMPPHSPQLPILELQGPSLPHVFEKHLEDFQKAAEPALVTNLVHEIAFARSKGE
jgi:hypothetical protein